MRATGLILAAFVLTWLSPVALLLIAPIVLGVPHVASDFRFLVFRPLRHGGGRDLAWLTWAALLLPLAAFVALRVAVYLGHPAHPRAEVLLGCSAAVAAVVLTRRASLPRQGLVLLALGGLALAAFRWPWQVLLLFGHVHNLVAFGLWFVWAGAPRRAAIAYLACLVALLVGLPAFSTRAVGGLDLHMLSGSLAPGFSDALASRVVASYAFAQMVHYVVWIDLVPASQRGTSVRADLGTLGLVAAGVATLALCAWGAFDPFQARVTYLSLALFHGWLEVAVVAHLWVGRGSIALPGAAPARRPAVALSA